MPASLRFPADITRAAARERLATATTATEFPGRLAIPVPLALAALSLRDCRCIDFGDSIAIVPNPDYSTRRYIVRPA